MSTTTTAGALTQGQTILWFDSRLSGFGKFRVAVARPLPGDITRLELTSVSGTKITWSGPSTAEIQLPKSTGRKRNA